MAASGWWKTIIVPPAIALFLYFLLVHFLIPLYRQRTRYSQYLPVSLSLPESTRVPKTAYERIKSWTTKRLSRVLGESWHVRQQFYDEEDESFLGDEELEERLGPDRPRQEDERGAARPALGERRLSRELEAGFRDDSDEETDARKASRNARREQST